jgi:nucleoside-diphosphate-sugar epimerase
VDAIVECIRNSGADNQVFNVVDQDPITKSAYMERVIKPLYPRAIVIYLPMPLLVALTWVQERVLALLGKRAPLTIYRLMSSQKRVRYSTSRIENAIGWHSRITFEQGVAHLLREPGRKPDSGERSVGT